MTKWWSHTCCAFAQNCRNLDRESAGTSETWRNLFIIREEHRAEEKNIFFSTFILWEKVWPLTCEDMQGQGVGTKVLHRLTLASGILECLCFAGVVFGYASLVFVLKEDGYFSQLCDTVPDTNSNATITGETLCCCQRRCCHEVAGDDDVRGGQKPVLSCSTVSELHTYEPNKYKYYQLKLRLSDFFPLGVKSNWPEESKFRTHICFQLCYGLEFIHHPAANFASSLKSTQWAERDWVALVTCILWQFTGSLLRSSSFELSSFKGPHTTKSIWVLQ